jgi:hypothetical protein
MAANGSLRVGTLDWTRRTRGRLRPRDRARLLGQGTISQLADLPRQTLARLGLRPRRLARFDVDALRVPDSAAARTAEEVCARMRPEMLVAHSHRTYAWAAILAAHEGVGFDEEVVYVGSLLHDLGLSEDHPPQAGSCFTLVGADAALRAGEAAGWERERAELAAEAITLHMNLRPSPDCVEARLVAAATQLDVIGQGHWRVAPETVEAVLRRHPRHDVKDGMAAIFHDQARAHPGTRAHFYQRYLGLGLLIRLAPYES